MSWQLSRPSFQPCLFRATLEHLQSDSTNATLVKTTSFVSPPHKLYLQFIPASGALTHCGELGELFWDAGKNEAEWDNINNIVHILFRLPISTLLVFFRQHTISGILPRTLHFFILQSHSFGQSFLEQHPFIYLPSPHLLDSKPNIMASSTALRQRLLQDIVELQTKPYPNISIHLQDDQFEKICLVLDVAGYGPMHLTMEIPSTFPLDPPEVQMNSEIIHPNIFGSYICASILNTVEGYTPAYTLKGIAIQLLSFFGSDKIEQSGGGYSFDLNKYRASQHHVRDGYRCEKCKFNTPDPVRTHRNSLADYLSNEDFEHISDGSESGQGSKSPRFRSQNARRKSAQSPRSEGKKIVKLPTSEPTPPYTPTLSTLTSGALQKANLPDEILLSICENLDYEELMAFARVWPRIASLIPQYDIIRTRELQCFCFKKGYLETELGVGITVENKAITSEFDLLSLTAFNKHHIRRSVQGKEFDQWLPLPISYGHWRRVNRYLSSALTTVGRQAGLGGSLVQVVYKFMNDIVVKLNQAAENVGKPVRHYHYREPVQSSLTHASEKAIESYFHLFHLLLCMATAQPSIVASANQLLQSFLSGRTTKSNIPNLGYLLVAALITDIPINSKLLKAVVRETITRNVVWMLKEKPELAFLETTGTHSTYRLRETFRASKTSYRLLMFLNLFRRTAVGSPRTKSLVQLRDEAFSRHGAPPLGSAACLASSIKRIQQIDNFPDFLDAMGIEKGGPVAFCNFLRQTIKDSEKLGYSRMPLSQGQAYALRKFVEGNVPGGEGLGGFLAPKMSGPQRSFFPNNRGDDGGNSRGLGMADRGRGSRGRRGGRGGY